MKNFNKTLNEDISLLRTLHANKDKREFNNFKTEVMRRHNISKATVYREMKKETPGEYKIPNYNPPKMDIQLQEILMVRELLLSGRQATEIIKIMGRELGINYYWDRFDRARALGEKLSEEEYDPKKTSFAVNGRMFLTKLFNIEYMAPGTYDEIPVKGHTLKVTKGFFDNMILQLMKHNYMGKDDNALKYLLFEVESHFMMKDNVMRKIEELTQSGETASAYALKSLYETREKLEKKDRAMYKLKRYLLENNPWGLNKNPDAKIEKAETEKAENKEEENTENKEERKKAKKKKEDKNTEKEEIKEEETKKPGEISYRLSPDDLKPVPAAEVKGMKIKIPDQTPGAEILPDGKRFVGQTIRQRMRNGKLTGVTVIKKYS